MLVRRRKRRKAAPRAAHCLSRLSLYEQKPGGHTARKELHHSATAETAARQGAKQLGGIDVLVNNAGLYETVAIEKISLKQWDEMFNTNARGPFLFSRACRPYLQRSRGRIVNLGSLGGLRPWTSHAHYCQSKAALHMQTQLLAKAFAPEIAVNCVAPGMIELGDRPASRSFMRHLGEKTPMQRNGNAADVAAAVLLMAQMPHFLTGQILIVDGGLGLV